MNDKTSPGENNQPTSNARQTRSALDSYRKAVALKYDGYTAPEVTASGTGSVAAEIIELARANGIPLYENTELTEMLSLLDLGEKIPQELYLIIAQIIALAYNLKPGSGISQHES